MRYFARKIDYAAAIHTYVALIEIFGDNRPFCSVLYRYVADPDGTVEYAMQIFSLAEDGKEVFPYGRDGYMGGERQWIQTSDWLNDVAVGGGYRKHKDGTLVPIDMSCLSDGDGQGILPI